jgi:hypothetical protein
LDKARITMNWSKVTRQGHVVVVTSRFAAILWLGSRISTNNKPADTTPPGWQESVILYNPNSHRNRSAHDKRCILINSKIISYYCEPTKIDF